MDAFTKSEMEKEREALIGNHSVFNSHRSRDSTSSGSFSNVSNDSIITIESPELENDSADTSDASGVFPGRILNVVAPMPLMGSRGTFSYPDLESEMGVIDSEQPRLIRNADGGDAEMITRSMCYPDVVFDVEWEHVEQPTTPTEPQQQVLYPWGGALNGKFFSVEQSNLKLLQEGTFQFGALLGAGSYGFVVEGVNLHTGEAVAVKMSNGTAEANAHLENEINLLKSINDAGFPSCKWTGVQGDQKVLIMEKFGPSLSKLLAPCNGAFTLKTTLMLADQLVVKLQKLHGFGFIHCDIKPDNIVMGVGELRCNQAFLIDYGLAKARNHSNYLPGDIMYASLNAHRGGELGPLDDLESLGYALFYLHQGKLPWSYLLTLGLPQSELYEQVYDMKTQLTRGKVQGYPPWYNKYMRFCLWNCEGEPDYYKIRRMFQDEMNRNQFAFDCQYDWVLHKYVNQYALCQ